MKVTVLSTLTEFTAAAELLGRVWDGGPDAVAPAELLRALGHGGNYIAGAWDDSTLVGAALGWYGRDERGWYLHSHVTGVAPEYQNRGVGLQLKLHQKEWAAAQGIERVVWTFDPLVRRNVVFNLRKLGARIVAYERDFYGPMDDPVNRGDQSDRCIIEWTNAADAPLPPPELGVDVGDDGGPVVDEGDGDVVGVRVRGHRRAAARRSDVRARARRLAVRAAMGDRMENGFAVDGMTDDGTYVLTSDRDLDMKIDGFELRVVRMPLVAPFRTSFGTETSRDVLLVRARTPDGDGWGECVVSIEPLYSEEYVDGAIDVIKAHLLPRLFAAGDLTAAEVASVLAPVRGHPMSKAAIEAAVLDAELRTAGVSLAQHLGAVRDAVDAGVSVGIMDSMPALLDAVDGYLADGYRRIKLKIEPGWDVEMVATVRSHVGEAVPLQVDANAAYTVDDAPHLQGLDAFELLLIEQPLAEDDLLGHAELAGVVATRICLDESIRSARDTATAIAIGACQIVNIKPGRVGGLLEARRIHDVCAAHDVPVWCGGMLETGIGRAANVALAALPNFRLPNDTSASDRYYAVDITEPFVLDDGRLRVPTGPGIGVEPDPAILDAVTVTKEWIGA